MHVSAEVSGPSLGVRVMLYIGLCTFPWSCVHRSELSVCIQAVSPIQSLAQGEPPFWQVGHPGSLCSQQYPLTQTLVSPRRILTGCLRSCGLPSPRTRAPASCSAASVARAGPRWPWCWLCSPSGTSEYVRPCCEDSSAQADGSLVLGILAVPAGCGGREDARGKTRLADPWQGAPRPSSCLPSGLPGGGRGGTRECA